MTTRKLTHMSNHILAVAAIFLVLSTSAEADTSVLHCKGVNYIYQSGIGKGPAKREKASLTIKLDFQAMTGELANGNELKTTQLTIKYGAYQGFFPGEKQIFGTNVIGEEVEVNPALDLLELRYLVADEKKFLSFTGICKR